jgi:hypothetical protein
MESIGIPKLESRGVAILERQTYPILGIYIKCNTIKER